MPIIIRGEIRSFQILLSEQHTGKYKEDEAKNNSEPTTTDISDTSIFIYNSKVKEYVRLEVSGLFRYDGC